jgi:O-antigen/teichoic acid export membrane protein
MVMGYINVLKYLIGADYWTGLKVVPIVMAAEIMMGIYFNLSFWYKIIDKTIWGAVFSGIGCAVLLAVNIIFVPRYGYIACAWGGFAGYGTAMIISYFVGQKYYPLDYPLKEIAVYLLLAFACFEVMRYFADFPLWGSLAINTLVILLFVGYILWRDFPLGKLPVVGKYFRKNK